MRDRLIYQHNERHYVSRTGWLRAAVLGANDGIISVSSLVVGIASANAPQSDVMLAGIAGLVAGAMSMAAGEYVSVSSQSDLEQADITRERKELIETSEAELQELTDIYIDRGVEPSLARQVSKQMTDHDALATHAREELGISDLTAAKPIQAAISSAAAFSLGAALPLISVILIPPAHFVVISSILCIILLGLLGALAARTGGAPALKPALRVMIWGAGAMGLTALIGSLVGTATF